MLSLCGAEDEDDYYDASDNELEEKEKKLYKQSTCLYSGSDDHESKIITNTENSKELHVATFFLFAFLRHLSKIGTITGGFKLQHAFDEKYLDNAIEIIRKLG